MVTHASAFMEIPEAVKIVKTMDGIAYESASVQPALALRDRLDPAGATGQGRPVDAGSGAGRQFPITGLFVYKEFDQYTDFIERDWLYRFWKEGLPKHRPEYAHYQTHFPMRMEPSRRSAWVGPALLLAMLKRLI